MLHHPRVPSRLLTSGAPSGGAVATTAVAPDQPGGVVVHSGDDYATKLVKYIPPDSSAHTSSSRRPSGL